MDFIANNFWPFIYGSFIGTGLFAVYVEVAPGLGSLLIRPNTNNEPTINLRSLFNLMKEPLRNINFWKIQNLDINYIFVVTASGSLGVLFNQIWQLNK